MSVKRKSAISLRISAKIWHNQGLGKDTVRTNRTIELIRVMPFGEVNHKINMAILKIFLIKELFIFSFARLFEFMVGLYFLRSVQFTFSL